jgi:MFS superfamily sulfate permease-like transporter
MGMLVADARGVLDATTVAVIAVPVLMGLATIAGLFRIPQLPLPKTVPFV